MRLDDLFEARRNPELNFDGRLNDRMSSAFGFLSQFKPVTGDDPTYFVTFTEIKKVGINPRSKYQTPLGIYTYPIVPEIVLGHMKKELPFAGEENYISVVQSVVGYESILWFDQNGSYKDYERDHGKLLQFLEDGYSYGGQDTKGFLADAAHNAFDPNDPQSVIWNQSRWVAAAASVKRNWHEAQYRLEEIGNMLEKHANDIPNIAIHWNSILRKVLGYEAVVDMGTGTIHQNEPMQAVFLSREAIQLVDQRSNQNAANRGPKHMTMLELYHAAHRREISWEVFYSAINRVLFPSTKQALFRINKVQHFIDRPVGSELDTVMQQVAERHMNRTEAAHFKVGVRVMMDKPLFRVTDETRALLLDQIVRCVAEYAPIHSQATEMSDIASALDDTMDKFNFTPQEVRASLQRLELDQLATSF